jgi:hypothetical protein
VIINNFNFGSISVLPPEADSLLIVYADAIPTLQLSFQFLKMIRGRLPEIRKRHSGIGKLGTATILFGTLIASGAPVHKRGRYQDSKTGDGSL